MDSGPRVRNLNGGMSNHASSTPSRESQVGIQVIDEDQNFKWGTHCPCGLHAADDPSEGLTQYLTTKEFVNAGFNYHVVSVFGSQSTGKSTLLNHLFGTRFSVMSENERRQTTKGIWMSSNAARHGPGKEGTMARNILVMDVEGTDGRERGEDQDFERKAALFALATSEVLIVNIWEHQVGLYQGANMGLLKVVFEVNLDLFLRGRPKDARQRSLLFFVIRDHLGTTPLSNLQNTLTTDLTRIWSGLNKPAGLERSSIDDFFDFAFVALPHKILQPERFVEEVSKLGTRFREGDSASKLQGPKGTFLPVYHRRVPADGFSTYARGVWDQIVNNKDLDLPTQQELLAQFRCDEIMREAFIAFDATILPFEQQQVHNSKSGAAVVLENLGAAMRSARAIAIDDFGNQASRYQKTVYNRKRNELESKLDARLKALFQGQLSAAHQNGLSDFCDSVSGAVKANQKRGDNYDFGDIVTQTKSKALARYERAARDVMLDGVPWSDFSQEYSLFLREIEGATARLRSDELRRLATRTERWVRTRLGEAVGLEFNKLGSSHGAATALDQPERNLWDRIWAVFTKTVAEASSRFLAKAQGFDASPDELQLGEWRLRRKSWGMLKARLEEEMMEGNLLLKLRENFEDKFRYDEAGVPRVWRPTDDIEGIYTKARDSTLTLVPLLALFCISSPSGPPPLPDWIGAVPQSMISMDDEDLAPIGGVDDGDGATLEDEMTLISDVRRQELTSRFKKTADGVYVEAKRSAVGGITQVPLYFYGLLLALGWNEILAGRLSSKSQEWCS